MGANDKSKTKPPLPPKPQIKSSIPQKDSLDSPPCSTSTTNDVQYRPTPKPRLRKPSSLKQSLTQAGNAEQVPVPAMDSAASNGSTESHSVPPACPPCCPCVCHYASKNEPIKTQQHEDNYIISSDCNDNKESRRVPPDIPVPPRPLPKVKMIIMNVGGPTDDNNNNEGVYTEADMPKHDDIAPKENEPQPSDVTLNVPTQKPIPTPRKGGQDKMAVKEQIKQLNNAYNIFRSYTRGTKIRKKKNKADQTKGKKLSISRCSRSKSLQTSTRPARLQSSAVKVRRTRSSVNRETKEKDGYSWKILQGGLWQEHSVVKESGILSQLSKEEICLQESIYEVVTSEQSYLERLCVVVNHFMNSEELDSAIVPQDQKSLFSSIEKMTIISQNFLDSLVQHLGPKCLFCEALCDVVHHHSIGPFSAYVEYIRNMPSQKQTLVNLRKESPHFVEILNKLQDDPCCNRLPFDSFLLLPFQRISHLKILMDTVVKRTASHPEVQASAEAALTGISKVLEECNTEVGKMEQIEELINIANKTKFECKALPIVSSSRWLIKNGELTQLALNEKIIGQKKNCAVHLLLFNDLLLVASKKGSDRYVVHDHVNPSLIEVTEGAKVKDCLEGYEVSRVFQLAILKNHRGISCQFLLQASTQEERDNWLKLLMYDEQDCPQVRCIEAYNGQQPHELSLQLEDIVNISQKTSDGLMQGQRLRDEKSGWFPAKCVIDIPNEHAQRRILLQRHLVLQTAANIIKHRSICQDQHTTTCFDKL